MRSCLSACIITFPISAAGFPPLANLINIVCNFSKEVYVITSSDFSRIYSRGKHEIFFYGISNASDSNRELNNLLIALLKYFKAQVEIVARIFAIHSHVDLYLFFIGGETLLLPVLFTKLLGKKVVLCHSGSILRSARYQKIPLVNALAIVRNLTRSFADKIIVYSKAIIREDDLQKFAFKTAIAHEHCVDFNVFNLNTPFTNRDNIVGYVGRFTLEKGILNLVEAIPLVLKQMENVNFVLIGEGPLFSTVNRIISGFSGYKVKILKWVPHKELPKFLNELKLLVLPSASEGLPNIVLEAMACGTPVLATPVGAIPDIIKDGETGFLLQSEDPKHVSEKIVVLLKESDLLEKVSKNAHRLVQEGFNEEESIKTWQGILKQLTTN